MIKTNALPECHGLVGKVFGHAFRPRCEYGPSAIESASGRGLSARDVAEIMNSGREETYLGDRCARCGLFISSKDEGYQ